MRTRMKTLKQILQESQRHFSYRLKTVVDLDDEQLSDLERLLRRYDLRASSAPKKLEFKQDSLEFRDIENADVYYLDFEIGVPVSAYILQQEVRSVLNIPEKFVVVRSDNEPQEVESGRLQIIRNLAILAKQEGAPLKGSLLSTDSEYLDAEQPLVTDVYGDTYNSKFLNLLAQIAHKRGVSVFQTSSDLNNVSEIQKLQQQPEHDDFNAHISGVKPVYKPVDDDAPVEYGYLAPAGNFDDDIKQYFRVSRNNKGEKIVSQKSTDPVRKIKQGNSR